MPSPHHLWSSLRQVFASFFVKVAKKILEIILLVWFSDTTKTLSTIYGDIMILDDDLSVKGDEEDDAMSSSSGISSSSFSNSSVYNRERTERMLDEILEDENEDIFDDDVDESSISCMDNIEEVKRINGKCITKTIDQNKQLIKHLGKNDSLSENNTQLFNRNVGTVVLDLVR